MNPVPPGTEIACIKRYIGTKAGELSLRVGNRVAFEGIATAHGFWHGRVINPNDGQPSGKSGIFPSECVSTVNLVTAVMAADSPTDTANSPQSMREERSKQHADIIAAKVR